jgi:cysteine desulfurase / selenocysteine lyase
MTHSPFSGEELNDLRSNFPHIANGHVYLNHAAIAPLSLPVTRAIASFIDERQTGPVDNLEHCLEITGETRGLISDYLNSPAPAQISFVGNTSEGISAIAEGLEWNPGDEIILNDMEFPTNVQPFRILKEKGVKTEILKSDQCRITPQQIEDAITPSTRMVSISAVQYLGGFRADLEAIGEICSRHDILFVVDAIQCLGFMQIDVQKCRIDALACGSHKWLMSPLGLGFLYTSEELALRLRPFKTGWLSVEEPWELSNYEQPWAPYSSHLEGGAPNMLGITGMGASLKNLNKIGTDRIRDHILYVTHYLLKRLEAEKNVTVITPAGQAERSGIISFKIDGVTDSDKYVSEMKKKKITISAREGLFRISPHYYNTTGEIDKALGELLKDD